MCLQMMARPLPGAVALLGSSASAAATTPCCPVASLPLEPLDSSLCALVMDSAWPLMVLPYPDLARHERRQIQLVAC